MQNIQPFIPGEREQVVSVGSDILGPSSHFILLYGDAMLFCREKHARRDGLLPKNRPSTHWPPDFRYPVIFRGGLGFGFFLHFQSFFLRFSLHFARRALPAAPERTIELNYGE